MCVTDKATVSGFILPLCPAARQSKMAGEGTSASVERRTVFHIWTDHRFNRSDLRNLTAEREQVIGAPREEVNCTGSGLHDIITRWQNPCVVPYQDRDQSWPEMQSLLNCPEAFELVDYSQTPQLKILSYTFVMFEPVAANDAYVIRTSFTRLQYRRS